MYPFKIIKIEDEGYSFELQGIKILVQDYAIKDDKHIITNPNKAIAYFTIENNIYGVTNEPRNFNTAEEFYDTMSDQYRIFTNQNLPAA
jgi:hypothetical protein